MNEFNFDGLVGPTHNYAGLSYGNVASKSNAGSISSPKQAAKQGLLKMRILMNLGIKQAVLPPQQRPNISLLRILGFTGNDQQILQQAYTYQPLLFNACFSAASMWAANMATISPSCNTLDGKLHITPANLAHNLHRAQEADFSHSLLNKIFSDQKYFKVHDPLPSYRDLSDEGAANHNVLCTEYGMPGLELFVYGKMGLQDNAQQPIQFPARQTRLASSSIIRKHGVLENNFLLVQQNPAAIDAGVFHNDVICVANKNVILYHAQAFLDWLPVKQKITEFFPGKVYFLEIEPRILSITQAVDTYIFNSQLVSVPGAKNNMTLIVPMECKNSSAAGEVLNNLIAGDNPISRVEYVECRESMRNGGGPACLRLRVVLTSEQQQACHQGIMLDANLYKALDAWIDKHYRDRLSPEDLLDPNLPQEVCTALDQLTQILKLGSIYDFQK